MTSHSRRQFGTLGQYHDAWASVLLSAPDSFKRFEGNKLVPVSNQQQALVEAFDKLRSGFHFVERKIKDERLVGIMREMLELSFEAYQSGEKKRGAHALQELEGMIWKGRELPAKYAVEAERRAFGEVVSFAGVRVSPYPLEKTASDLGEIQKILLQTAENYCRTFLQAQKEFKYFAWSLSRMGEVHKISEPSLKKLQKHLEDEAKSGAINGAIVAQIIINSANGMIRFQIHQQGMPRVEAIGKLDNWVYQRLRYHFYDPTIFSS